jgi:hypothetical protein
MHADISTIIASPDTYESDMFSWAVKLVSGVLISGQQHNIGKFPFAQLLKAANPLVRARRFLSNDRSRY